MTAHLDLDLNEGERLLRESAQGALAKVSPHRVLTISGGDGEAPVRAHWDMAVAMGWTGLLLPEAQGGSGLGVREVAVVAEQLGYGLFCGPFTAAAVLVPALLRAAEKDADAAALLGRIADGSITMAVACVRESGTWLAPESDLSAMAAGCPAVRRELVEYPDIATHFLVFDAVRAGTGPLDLSVAIVPAGPGCRVLPCQAFDVTCPVARVEFAAGALARAVRFGFRLAQDEFDALLGPYHVAVAAELVGLGQASLDRAVAHAKGRQQFGVAIGSFQAIKHRLADNFMRVESARLAVRHAAHDPGEGSSALIARILAAEAAIDAAGACIQMQGGMGFSWENDAHLYLKRARRLAAAFGSPREFRARIADNFVGAVLAEAGA